MKQKIIMIWFVFWCISMPLKAQTSIQSTQITAVQYYYDTDPGAGIAGNGGIITIIPVANVNQVFNFAVPNISTGAHILFVRARDEYGRWGVAERRLIIIDSVAEKITALQYFYDNDPGVGVAGNGGIINVTPSSSINQLFSFSVPNFAGGAHILFVRAKDEYGRWGIAERRLIIINSVSQTVESLEYYYDIDPGVGNGISIPITPAANVNFTASIPAPCLPVGTHTLFVRAKDEFGRWGIITRSTFSELTSVEAAVISPAGPLSFCTGSSVVLSTTTGSGIALQWFKDGGLISGATAKTLAVTTTGNYQVSVACNGFTALSNTVVVTENPLPTPSIIGNPIFCSGSSTILDAGVYSGYLWSTGATTQTATLTTSGLVSVTVTDVNGCVGSTSVTTSTFPKPSPPSFINNIYVCSNDLPATLGVNTPVGITVDWYATPSFGSILAGGTGTTSFMASAAGNYYAEARSVATGCLSASRTAVTLNVTLTPPSPEFITDVTACSNNLPVALNVNLPAGYMTIDWWDSPIGGFLISPGPPNYLVVFNAGTYYATTRNGMCYSIPRTAVQLTVNSVVSFYRDFDQDGYGNVNNTVLDCTAPAGYVADYSDCNDTIATMHPGATEICNNNIDDNCNGQTDEGCTITLNFRAFIEGLYVGNNTMMPVIDPINFPALCDSVVIELHDANIPYNFAFSAIGVIDINGYGQFVFPPGAFNHSYFIVFRHRNSIETWSNNPVMLNALQISYDFTAQ